MNDIYRAIQGEGAIPIRLELPPEDDTFNQQRLNLLVDFAANRNRSSTRWLPERLPDSFVGFSVADGRDQTVQRCDSIHCSRRHR